jgi:hypothetical protein
MLRKEALERQLREAEMAKQELMPDKSIGINTAANNVLD